MKKLYFLLFTFLVSIISYGQIIITGVIDGPLPDGLPKAVEFYVIEDIADLSIYGFGNANNGGGTDGQEYTFPSVQSSAGDFIYVSSESIGFNSFLGFASDDESGAANINGDDAIELFKNGSVIDVFGDINVDGTGQVWEYLDGWAYRKNKGEANNGVFVPSDWNYSTANALDGETSNATASSPFPIGLYSHSTASLTKNQIEGFAMYPNPVTNGELHFTSSNNSNKHIEIYSMIGKLVFQKELKQNQSINISNLNTGIYMVKVLEEGKMATRKIVVK